MLKIKFAKEIGMRVSLRRYWSGNDKGGLCPSGYGYHNAMKFVKDIDGFQAIIKLPREYGLYEDDFIEWPECCDFCKKPVPEGTIKQIFTQRKYDTPSGLLEPGCLYWNSWLPETFYWNNHKGPHLMCILPNGLEWNIDSRASNCTLPNDKTHRCWVRTGDPEAGNIHVDKNGLTCSAGAGSIQNGNYHGFLHNGYLT